MRDVQRQVARNRLPSTWAGPSSITNYWNFNTASPESEFGLKIYMLRPATFTSNSCLIRVIFRKLEKFVLYDFLLRRRNTVFENRIIEDNVWTQGEENKGRMEKIT
jgi:hypothetical protein